MANESSDLIAFRMDSNEKYFLLDLANIAGDRKINIYNWIECNRMINNVYNKSIQEKKNKKRRNWICKLKEIEWNRMK